MKKEDIKKLIKAKISWCLDNPTTNLSKDFQKGFVAGLEQTKIDKLKWQIHAETSITSIMLWVIIGKLFGGWVIGFCVFMIFGNIVTFIKSIAHLDSDYFKQNESLKLLNNLKQK